MDNATGMLQIAVDRYNEHVASCHVCKGTFFGPEGLPGHGTVCEDGWQLLADIEAKAAIGSNQSANQEGVR